MLSKDHGCRFIPTHVGNTSRCGTAGQQLPVHPHARGEHALRHATTGLTASGVRKIKAVLNPKLQLIGLLPTMVESTPFQRANFLQIVQRYHPLLIRIGDGPGDFASIPRRSSIAEAQAHGEVLWEMKKGAAREAWKEIEPALRALAGTVTGQQPSHPHAHAHAKSQPGAGHDTAA